MKRDLHNEYLKEKDAHPKKFEAALKYMNDYQTLNNPGGYKKPQRKDKEAWLESLITVEVIPQGKKINTTEMVNQIVSTVEVKIIGQIFS